MSDDLDRLTEQWILTFCEAPVLVDAELMRRVLADYERALKDRRDDLPVLRPARGLNFRGDERCEH